MNTTRKITKKGRVGGGFQLCNAIEHAVLARFVPTSYLTEHPRLGGKTFHSLHCRLPPSQASIAVSRVNTTNEQAKSTLQELDRMSRTRQVSHGSDLINTFEMHRQCLVLSVLPKVILCCFCFSFGLRFSFPAAEESARSASRVRKCSLYLFVIFDPGKAWLTRVGKCAHSWVHAGTLETCFHVMEMLKAKMARLRLQEVDRRKTQYAGQSWAS